MIHHDLDAPCRLAEPYDGLLTSGIAMEESCAPVEPSLFPLP
jgi:hypothetical protein